MSIREVESKRHKTCMQCNDTIYFGDTFVQYDAQWYLPFCTFSCFMEYMYETNNLTDCKLVQEGDAEC